MIPIIVAAKKSQLTSPSQSWVEETNASKNQIPKDYGQLLSKLVLKFFSQSLPCRTLQSVGVWSIKQTRNLYKMANPQKNKYATHKCSWALKNNHFYILFRIFYDMYQNNFRFFFSFCSSTKITRAYSCWYTRLRKALYSIHTLFPFLWHMAFCRTIIAENRISEQARQADVRGILQIN